MSQVSGVQHGERYIPKGYDPELYRIRHSAAHVLAQAVLEVFPDAKIAIGPPIEDGFYYDFDLPRSLTPQDLAALEQRMRDILRGNHAFLYREVSADEARDLFADQPYKLELIEGLVERQDEDAVISVYTQDSFTDLCRGPHVPDTSEINPDAVKLLNVAGAYWRGDERQPMLQRIYGTAWRTADELEMYLWRLEEARKRDHRLLGRQLDLFSTSEDVGAGLILWHPKGGVVRKLMENHWERRHAEGDYDIVFTPHIGKADLWKTSGHLDFYAESMYAPMDIDGTAYYLKPMNCPFHVQIFKSQVRSYRELPFRFAEEGTVYRYERSGTLLGLLRVRGFTQDDAHHFCRLDQMESEIDFVLAFCVEMLRDFGFTEIQAYLSTQPEKSVGKAHDWELAEASLEAALRKSGLSWEVDEGGGAFYGPKIDLKVSDALGREWQLSTIQFDFNLPERFDMTYIGEDNLPHRPYMVHRALLGSIERFFGVLIEHYGGAFPVWLSPVQAVVIPIADRHKAYALQVVSDLKKAGIRAHLDDSSSRMNKKIRDAQEQKIPYMLVVGDREQEVGGVSVRLRSEDDLGILSITDFAERVQTVVAAKDGL